ncbi:MAG: hypothetical protein JKX84_00570 [Flavobacteriales bacterium]|nr:hypothetical protein [Flavobacteriales bacterium]
MKKILILPYKIDHSLSEMSHLSEGILEEIIGLLSQNPLLKISSRSTSLYLDNNILPLDEIKKRFNIDVVIEGNVRLKNGAYQLAGRLYNTENEDVLLSSALLLKPDQWIKAVDQFVEEVLATLTDHRKQQDLVHPGTSLARDLYQKGLYHWNRYTYTELLMAVDYFKRSAKEDPTFALPFAGIADCYTVIGAMGYDEPKKTFALATQAVRSAIKLNSKRSESYVAAAMLNIFYERDFPKAKSNLEQALKLNKDNLKAHHVLAMYYVHKGDLTKAKEHSAITLKMDPLAIPHHAMFGRLTIYQRKFQLAIDYVNTVSLIEQTSVPLIEIRGMAHLFLEKYELAIEDFKYCKNAIANDPMLIANLAYAYSKSNFHEASRKEEEELRNLPIPRNTGIYDYSMGIVKLGQGDHKAFF